MICLASPVPVPGRSPSFSSDSPASLKANSASPLSGKMEYSPSPPMAQKVTIGFLHCKQKGWYFNNKIQ